MYDSLFPSPGWGPPGIALLKKRAGGAAGKVHGPANPAADDQQGDTAYGIGPVVLHAH